MVVPLDVTERDRWPAHAADELRAAKHNAGGGFHHVAVLHLAAVDGAWTALLGAAEDEDDADRT